MKSTSVIKMALVCIIVAGLTAGCSDRKAVATVNGKKITLAEYNKQTKVLQGLYQGRVLNTDDRRQVLEQMVKQELLVQEAVKAGLENDATIKQTIAEQKSMYRKGLQEQIESLKAQLDQVDEAVRSRNLIENLIKSKLKAKPISDKEAQMYYMQAKTQGMQLRSFEEERPRIEQQILIDQLVAQAKEKAAIDLKMDLITAGEALPLAPAPQALDPKAAAPKGAGKP